MPNTLFINDALGRLMDTYEMERGKSLALKAGLEYKSTFQRRHVTKSIQFRGHWAFLNAAISICKSDKSLMKVFHFPENVWQTW